MITITGTIEREHYQVLLKSGTNELLADEPLSAGGLDKGFSPSELLAAALAACTSATLRMYADRKKWDLEKTAVKVMLEHNQAENRTDIACEIRFFGNLSDAQKARLLEIANRCPVHRTLTNPINIQTKLV